MDLLLLLMLSNLLHLHSYLDLVPSLLSNCSPPPSASSSSAATSSATPLLFFAIASVLSYASSLRGCHQRRHHRSSYSDDDEDEDNSFSSSPPPPPRPHRSPSSSSTAFFSLPNSNRIWFMDPAAHDARWRSLYSLSYPLFMKLLNELHPLPFPTDHALTLALFRLSRGLSSPALACSLALPLPLSPAPPMLSPASSPHASTRPSSKSLPSTASSPLSNLFVTSPPSPTWLTWRRMGRSRWRQGEHGIRRGDLGHLI